MVESLSKRITTYNNGSYQVENFASAPTGTMQYYMHKEDKDSGVFLNSDKKPTVRSCASTGGCPAVFVLKEPTLKVTLTKQWQYYLIAINYRMELQYVADILDTALAFANGTGFREEPMRNYILGKDLNVVDSRGRPVLPKLDKDRTCSRNLLTGTVVANTLKLRTMNGNMPPPLKPGRTYPAVIADIDLDDYLYTPQHNPEMFVVANMVATKPGGLTSVSPFPRGAIYEWTNDNLPRTWLPLVSNETIYYPLSKLVKLPLGSPLPSPYRIVR